MTGEACREQGGAPGAAEGEGAALGVEQPEPPVLHQGGAHLLQVLGHQRRIKLHQEVSNDLFQDPGQLK